MTGAYRYTATVEYGCDDHIIDFEFYTIEEASEFTATVLKHYKPKPNDGNSEDIRVYIGMINTEEEE